MTTPRAVRPLAVLALLVAGTVPAGAVVNTHLDASNLPFVACNGRVAFRVGETAQNGTDLNTDGDANDFVLHVLDLGTGIVTNVGIDASGPLACTGDVFAFGVREANQGNLDRNGDGDVFDTVLETYNAATTTLTNLHLAVTSIVAADSLIAVTVNESSQGGVDRNGDGDFIDQVLAVVDPATLAITNVGYEASDTSHIVVQGSRVAFFTNESLQGHTDLNGDGDPSDVVAMIYDAGTATLINPHRAVVQTLGIQLNSAAAAFVVSEAAQGAVSDNGDLDAIDGVMNLYCFGTPACTTTGLVSLHVDASGGFTLGGDLLAFRTKERNQAGISLNGDMDVRDSVVQYYRLSTGVRKNTGWAGEAKIRILGDKLAFGVPERLQGHTNLNADPSTGNDADPRDVVLHVYDTLTDTIADTKRALWSRACRREAERPIPKGPCMAATDDTILFAAGEHEQGVGGFDFNGDTDTHDAVVQAVAVGTPTLVTNTGFAGEHKGALVAKGTLGAFRVSESDQGSSRNGDLDLGDRTITVYDTLSSTTTELHQAADPDMLIEGRSVVFRTHESEQGLTDLNGDGDTNDAVLQYQTFP